NAKSDDGRTPLLIASGIPGNTAVLKLLLDRGAHAAVKAPGLFGDTNPLAEAARASDEAAFRTLLEHGADVKSAGPAGGGGAGRGWGYRCGRAVTAAWKPS